MSGPAPPDVRVLSLGTGQWSRDLPGRDAGLLFSVARGRRSGVTAREVVGALTDTAVGSAAFLLRQLLGEKAVRVSLPLAADYEIDDPAAMPGLDAQADRFDLGRVHQPGGPPADLGAWLRRYW